MHIQLELRHGGDGRNFAKLASCALTPLILPIAESPAVGRAIGKFRTRFFSGSAFASILDGQGLRAAEVGKKVADLGIRQRFQQILRH
jgi:hypothetical protein